MFDFIAQKFEAALKNYVRYGVYCDLGFVGLNPREAELILAPIDMPLDKFYMNKMDAAYALAPEVFQNKMTPTDMCRARLRDIVVTYSPHYARLVAWCQWHDAHPEISYTDLCVIIAMITDHSAISVSMIQFALDNGLACLLPTDTGLASQEKFDRLYWAWYQDLCTRMANTKLSDLQ